MTKSWPQPLASRPRQENRAWTPGLSLCENRTYSGTVFPDHVSDFLFFFFSARVKGHESLADKRQKAQGMVEGLCVLRSVTNLSFWKTHSYKNQKIPQPWVVFSPSAFSSKRIWMLSGLFVGFKILLIIYSCWITDLRRLSNLLVIF